MADFQFYIDEKVTVWDRTKINIKADNYENAVSLMKQVFTGEIDVDQFAPEYETLVDTAEIISVDDNDGYETRELIFVENGEETIMTNKPIEDIEEEN